MRETDVLQREIVSYSMHDACESKIINRQNKNANENKIKVSS